jgi:hypothetical protein
VAQELSAVKQGSAVDQSWLTVPLPTLNQESLVKGHSTNCQQGKQLLPVWVNLPERQQVEKDYFKVPKGASSAGRIATSRDKTQPF